MLELSPLKRLLSLGLLAAAMLLPGTARAQAQPRRITAAVSNAERATLPGSAHPMAQAQFKTGRMASDVKLTGISIYFKRSEAQEADLQALLAAQQDPSSPLYHQWLTPQQFGARFGMSDADLATVQSWLQQQGFSIDSVANNRSILRFSGTVRQVEQTFQTELHNFTVNGEKHFAPAGDLSLPSALVPVVGTIHNLDNFRPRPMLKAPTLVAPNLTTTGGKVYFSPADINTVYNITPLRSGGITGAGQTIVIVGQSAIDTSDIARFQSAAGLTQKLPTLVLVPGTGTSTVVSGDQGESDLDLEWSSVIAPGANVYFVYTGNGSYTSGGSTYTYDVFDATQYAVDQKIGNIISISYGGCEAANSSFVTAYDPVVFAQAATQGQSVFASSGDSGATSCYPFTSLTTAVRQSLDVNYPASSPYVTAVGGTEIDKSNTAYMATGGAYWTANSGSSELASSALQYIPEVVWNDTTTSSTDVSAGGGGVSTKFTKPAYQTALTPADGYRDLPDISLYSSSSYPGYVFCSSDYTGTCTNGFATSSNGYLRGGGTSFAAPIFAAMTALIGEKKGYSTGQGLINTKLYSLASSSGSTTSGSYSAAAGFHDISSGTIACGNSTLCGSNGGATAAAGYDLASGLGSVDLYTLANNWPASSSTAVATTTTVTAPSGTLYSGSTYSFAVAVASTTGSTVPSGSVIVSVDGTTAGTYSLASGAYTFSTSFSTTGSHTVTAAYQGDSTHSTSSASATVTVTAASTACTGANCFTLSANPTSLTIAQGSSGSTTVTIASKNSYTGTVAFGLSSSSSSFVSYGCYKIASTAVTANGSATTTLTIYTSTSSCNTSSAAQSGTALRMISASGTQKLDSTSALRPMRTLLPVGGIAMAGLLLFGLRRRARRLGLFACLLLMGALSLTITSCGGGNSTSSTTTTTSVDKGTYTLTLTGTDSSTSTITNTTTVTVTVN